MQSFKQWRFYASALVLSLVLSPALLAQDSKAATAEQEAIKKAVVAETTAFFAKDLDVLKASWIHDADVLRMDINPSGASVAKGWPKIEAWYSETVAGLPEVKNFQARHENWVIRTAGDMAWVDFDEMLSAQVDGQPFETRGHGTRTLMKEDGQWKFVALTVESGDLFDNSPKGVEASLNSIGYKLLNAGNQTAALKVFLLNSQMNPESANVYDSLAEAYLKAGNKEQAIANYEKSIELNSGNQNARQALTKLKSE